MRKLKYRGKKAKNKPPKPYRSWLEHGLATGELKDLPYEPHHVTYDIIKRNRKYTPDFVSGDRLIEVKGRFIDSTEAQKYVQIKANGYQVCFIFQNPSTPLAWSKRRKDGSRCSHGEWASCHGFDWCGLNDIPEEWKLP